MRSTDCLGRWSRLEDVMRSRTPILFVSVVALLVGGLVVARPQAAHAAGFTVISNLDTAPGVCGTLGVGTLRDCINAANSAPGPNTITFAATVTSPIVLSSGELHITGSQNLTITGLGQGTTVIDGNAASRVFETDSGTTVTMTDLTVRNGSFTSAGFEGGGGIRNSGTLTLDRVTVSDNQALANSGAEATSGGLRVVDNATATIRNSTFSGNTAASDQDAAGGAIQDCCSGGAHTYISDSVFSNNSATTTTGQSYGGAIANHGAMQIVRTAFNDNFTTKTQAGGGNTGSGAIVSHGHLTVDQGTFHHNTSTGTFGRAAAGAIDICCGGGGPSLAVTRSSFDHNATNGATGASAGAIEICCGAVGSISDSTFDSNTTTGPGAEGGAVVVDTGVRGGGPALPIINSTFTGNSASGASATGGAISLSPDDGSLLTLALTNDTIDQNSAPAGANISVGGGQTLTVLNTIISGSPASNCLIDQGGTLTDLGHNLDDGSASTCGFSTAQSDVLGAGPLLGGLAANGGSTRTQALLAGSPAIDKALNSGCPASDQRGLTRFPTGDPTCDIGAFEVQPAAAAVAAVPGLPAAGTPPLPLTAGASQLGLGALLGGLALAVGVALRTYRASTARRRQVIT
jgi:hypothetical protein